MFIYIQMVEKFKEWISISTFYISNKPTEHPPCSNLFTFPFAACKTK